MRFQEHLNQQRVHPGRIRPDLLVLPLRTLGRGQLQPVQGALDRQGRASPTPPVGTPPSGRPLVQKTGTGTTCTSH